MKDFRKTLLISCVLIISSYITAQNELYAPFEDTVTITAARIPLKMHEAGRSISIINAETLKQAPISTLEDVLRFVTGVELQSRNGFGAQSDLSLRGSTFNQVLVLLDGMRLNDPLTGHFNAYFPVAAAELARIEVLKGPAAAMYGPDAVGGVIHLLTKSYVELGRTAEDLDAQVTLNYGSHDLWQANGGLFKSIGKFKFSIGARLQTSDGEAIASQTIINDVDTTFLSEYRNYFDLKNITTSIGFPIGNWNMYYRMAYDYRDFSARYFYTNSTFDQSVEKTTAFWNHAHLERSSANQKHSFDLAYRYSTDDFLFNPLFPGNEHTMRLYNGQYNYFRTIGEAWRFNAGIQIDQRSIESSDRGNHEDVHFGGYLQAIFQPNPSWLIGGSTRVDYDENYDIEWLPQFNVSYLQQKWSFRALVGRGIRAADYTERYVSNNLPAPISPGRNYGNPDLRAESSWSTEIGFDWGRNLPVKFSGTLFWRYSDRLIDYVFTPADQIPNNAPLTPGADYFYAQNIAQINTIGAESELAMMSTITPNVTGTFTVGYTYLNTSNEAGIASVYLSNHARHLLQGQLNLQHTNGFFQLNTLYKARNTRAAQTINQSLSPSYQVWHLKSGYYLNNRLTVQIHIQNLFNSSYQEILGAPMPRRWLMGGVNWEIR